jgi:hypothetical protein
MPMRVRRFFVFAALLGLAAGCAHRPAPPGPATTAAALAPVTPRPLAASHDSDPTPATRRSRPGTPFTRAQPDQPFSPLLVVTTQVAHDDMFLHVLSGSGPGYQPVRKLYRGQRVFILPLARNYAFDALETADLTFELLVRKPDGRLDGSPLSASLWQGTVSTPDLLLYPSSTVSFYAAPDDPVGDYQIVVRIHDHLAGIVSELSQTLAIEDYTAPPLPADFDSERWFQSYYLAPSPEFALPALPLFFQKLPADKRAGAIPPLLGFYDQILSDNPWLVSAFGARLATADADEAFALSLVLGFHLRSTPTPPEGLDADLWARLADFRGHAWPADPDAPLLQASQLDALWGRFFASALYAPLQRLLEPLSNTADLGAAERWRKALPGVENQEMLPLPDPEDPATPVEIRREILLRTALWTLRANARQHPLVRGYLEQTLRTGDLAPGARTLLERALRVDTVPVTPAAPAVAAAPSAPNS